MSTVREYEKVVTFTVRMRVSQNEDDAEQPIPTPEAVVAAFRSYTGDDLISYKALAETYNLPASVTLAVESATIT